MKLKLTIPAIKGLACEKGKSQTLVFDEELECFGVRVTPMGTKSFIVQRRLDGKDVRRTIGRWPEMTVNEAREKARRVLQDMREGIDPLEVKKERERKRRADDALAVTLQDVADEYLENKRIAQQPLSERHKSDIRNHMARNFKEWASRPVRDITVDDCIKLHAKIVRRGAAAQADQAFTILRSLLNRVQVTHIDARTGMPLIVQVNPASLMFKRTGRYVQQKREATIPPDKLAAVWSMLQHRRDPAFNTPADCVSADMVILMLLTGMRIGEVERLRWEDVDLAAKVPTLHIPINKTKKPLTVPLSTQLVQMLTTRPQRKGNPFVFPERDPAGKGHAKNPRVMWGETPPETWGLMSRTAGVKLSAHDMRKTYIVAGQALGIEIHRIELLTNHKAKTVTLKHYTNTSDLRWLAPEQQRISDYLTGATAQQ